MTDASLKGQLLVATPVLREPTFARSVIAVLEHGPTTGAVGVVLNQPTEVALDDVVPAVSGVVSGPPLLFCGGPVSPQTAIAVGWARADEESYGWSYVSLPLVTVDLDHDPALLAASLRAMRVFSGYAGWSPGQLEGEIDEGAWYVVDALPADAFAPEPDRLWAAVLRRQGWPLSAVAVCPLDPTMN